MSREPVVGIASGGGAYARVLRWLVPGSRRRIGWVGAFAWVGARLPRCHALIGPGAGAWSPGGGLRPARLRRHSGGDQQQRLAPHPALGPLLLTGRSAALMAAGVAVVHEHPEERAGDGSTLLAPVEAPCRFRVGSSAGGRLPRAVKQASFSGIASSLGRRRRLGRLRIFFSPGSGQSLFTPFGETTFLLARPTALAQTRFAPSTGGHTRAVAQRCRSQRGKKTELAAQKCVQGVLCEHTSSPLCMPAVHRIRPSVGPL